MPRFTAEFMCDKDAENIGKKNIDINLNGKEMAGTQAEFRQSSAHSGFSMELIPKLWPPR